jgi:hypothetical protein
VIASAAAWLEATELATWTRESPSIWAYPTILTLHTAGLGIVVGAGAVIDLRLLGFGRRIPAAALAPLFTIIGWAFALNAATGVMLFMADATAKSKQLVFFVKLALIVLALGTTLAQRRLLLWNPVSAAFQGDRTPTGSLRRLAVASLILWTGAITAGRLMAYL